MLDKVNREFYYARVSSKGQNLARQIKEFYDMGAADENIIVDKKSGKNFVRPGYEMLKGKGGLKPGDTLIVKELDRLGRNKEGIKRELEYWKSVGVRVKILDVPVTMQDFPENQTWIQEMVLNILIEVISSIAEQERKQINQRILEGIEAMPIIDGKRVSTRTSRPVGRPPVEYPENWDVLYSLWRDRYITTKEFYRESGIKRTTFYKKLKEYSGKTR